MISRLSSPMRGKQFSPLRKEPVLTTRRCLVVCLLLAAAWVGSREYRRDLNPAPLLLARQVVQPSGPCEPRPGPLVLNPGACAGASVTCAQLNCNGCIPSCFGSGSIYNMMPAGGTTNKTAQIDVCSEAGYTYQVYLCAGTGAGCTCTTTLRSSNFFRCDLVPTVPVGVLCMNRSSSTGAFTDSSATSYRRSLPS